MSDRLANVLASVDAANAADPKRQVDADGEEWPEAQLYGQRMSLELERLFGDSVSDVLKIAARGQHIQRWQIKRDGYPQGRVGYLNWRRDQGKAHGAKLGLLMQDAGYDKEDCTRVGVLLRKEGIKRDPEVQMLEDVICFVFLKWYFADFAAKHDATKILDIVAKTARKMSVAARTRVLREFELPDTLAEAVKKAA